MRVETILFLICIMAMFWHNSSTSDRIADMDKRMVERYAQVLAVEVEIFRLQMQLENDETSNDNSSEIKRLSKEIKSLRIDMGSGGTDDEDIEKKISAFRDKIKERQK